MFYQGWYYFGKATFDVKDQIDHILECNGSICTQRWYLLWRVNRQKRWPWDLLSNLLSYTFNPDFILPWPWPARTRHNLVHKFIDDIVAPIEKSGFNKLQIKHRFSLPCNRVPWWEGTGLSVISMAAVNISRLKGFGPAVSRTHFLAAGVS